MGWQTPRTDWKATDRFNISDYNRIKNNFIFLQERIDNLYRYIELENMGEDLTEYTQDFNFNYFNAWEQNLNIFNELLFHKDYGFSQTFFGNGPFITASELIRIENAMLDMKKTIERQELSLRKIPFVLGQYREVRV